jgi:hypothetical protein
MYRTQIPCQRKSPIRKTGLIFKLSAPRTGPYRITHTQATLIVARATITAIKQIVAPPES